MRVLILILVFFVLAIPALAQNETTSPPQELSDFLWTKRVILIFADSPKDPNFIRQMNMLDDGTSEFDDRDVAVISDASPADNSNFRQKFHPRGFQLVLLGKDGKVKLRKPRPWSVRELSRAIDKMPLRIEELRSRRQ